MEGKVDRTENWSLDAAEGQYPDAATLESVRALGHRKGFQTLIDLPIDALASFVHLILVSEIP